MSIGQRLKSAREAKGIALEEVVRFTKIQRKILEAIETDQLEEVLDPVYAKIFLKKYAAFLGLDGEALVGEYIALHGPIPERSLSPQTELTKTSPAGLPLQQVLFPTGIGIVALIGAVFLAYLSADLYDTLKDRKSSGSSRGAARAAVSKASGAKPSAAPKTPEAPKLVIPRSQPLKLEVRTKAEVWMQVKSDGVVVFQNVLPKAAREIWTAKDELELWTGNSSALELQLNGKPLEPIGVGVKKGIKITRRGVELPEER